MTRALQPSGRASLHLNPQLCFSQENSRQRGTCHIASEAYPPGPLTSKDPSKALYLFLYSFFFFFLYSFCPKGPPPTQTVKASGPKHPSSLLADTWAQHRMHS